ncbi:MAG TPA: hypothetical protein VJJ53_03250, partial [Candidatus Nanoarchaeia archaeon]|nr:hypothetical protein [Candidatus Nanoarchaeia archaeon]
MWVLLVLFIALLLLLAKEEEKEKEPKLRRVEQRFFAYIFASVLYAIKRSCKRVIINLIRGEIDIYKFFKHTIKTLIDDIKEIFYISDEYLREKYSKAKYYQLLNYIRDEANKISYEVQYGFYKDIQKRLGKLRFLFYKLPIKITRSENALESQLSKLENSVEIGFLVDQAAMHLEIKQVRRARMLLDRISHYAFIPDGIISDKYYSCINYYEHFLYKEQHSSILHKVTTALTKGKLRLALKHYVRFVEVSKKLSWHEDIKGKQRIYNLLELLQEKLHILFLRESAKGKANKIKFIKVHLAKVKLPRLEFALPPYLLHFYEKLDDIYRLIKTKNIK